MCIGKKWLRFGFAKKLWFLVQFRFYKINHDFGYFVSVRPTFVWRRRRHLSFTYFRAELVQLIVSRSDSEPEVQRHGMKKNILIVDPTMLQDELWMRQREKLSPNCRSRFFENRTAETEFSVFEFWGRFSLVQFLENRYPTFSSGFCTPLLKMKTKNSRLRPQNLGPDNDQD